MNDISSSSIIPTFKIVFRFDQHVIILKFNNHIRVQNHLFLLKLISFSSCTFGLDQMDSNSHLCNLRCSRIPDQVQQEVCIYWGSYLDNALTNNHCLHYKALRSFFLLWQTLFKGLPAPFGSHRPDVQSLLWLHLSPSPSFLLHVGCPSPFARSHLSEAHRSTACSPRPQCIPFAKPPTGT